ncbi:hypothetical protein TNCV_3750621 [Trichonephila clavipes]|nr:hypothetical protein TNCV_3750621 [Trichonephila clavipes]
MPGISRTGAAASDIRATRYSFESSATETSRNITTRVIERDTSGEIYYFPEDSELANMVTNDVKIAKLAANLISKNDANLALPPSSH